MPPTAAPCHDVIPWKASHASMLAEGGFCSTVISLVAPVCFSVATIVLPSPPSSVDLNAASYSMPRASQYVTVASLAPAWKRVYSRRSCSGASPSLRIYVRLPLALVTVKSGGAALVIARAALVLALSLGLRGSSLLGVGMASAAARNMPCARHGGSVFAHLKRKSARLSCVPRLRRICPMGEMRSATRCEIAVPEWPSDGRK
mmetsp:Transcript_45520/g.119593  ORF Transcript_45520/g.119593 Transcript_45520/m.119593 type:complete len:203 (-) Transcript_45520:547-1155(-)